MAEPLIAPAPTAPNPAPTPVPTPAPAPAGANTPTVPEGGMDEFADGLDSMMRPEAKKPAATPPAPDKKEPAKPGEAVPKSGDQKPPVPAPVEGPAQLRKALAEIKEKYAGLEKTVANERRETQEKLSAFQKQKVLTPEQEKKFAETEARAAKLEAELYARDFSQSPEYKDKYQAKWEKRSREAMNDVKAMQVKTKTKDPATGEDVESARSATANDWARVMDAPSRVAAMDIAEELFGSKAGIVMEHRNALKGIEEQAQEEVDTRRKSFDSDREKYFGEMTTKQQRYEETVAHHERLLVEKYPDLFGDDPNDADATAALAKGRTFFEKAMSLPQQSPERAQANAVLKNWAISVPRLVHTNNKLKAENESLREELGKFRKSDPGEGGEAAPAEAKKDEISGTDELAEMIGKAT